MEFLRKFTCVVASSLVPILLFGFGIGLGVMQVFGSSNHLKQALGEHQVYESLVGSLIATSEQKQVLDQRIPTDHPDIKQIIQNAVPPDYIKGQTEGFLDGLYLWIRGEVSDLDVEINLTDAKNNLVSGLTHYAAARSASLPTCGPGAAFDASSFDLLTASCIPQGIDRELVLAQFRNELATDLIENPVVSEEQLSSNGKSLEEQLRILPDGYRTIMTSLWVSGIAAVALTILLVLCSPTVRNGLKRAGAIFVVAGSSSVVFALLSILVLQRLVAMWAEGEFQLSLAHTIGSLLSGVRSWWLGYAILLVVLGAGMLIAIRFIKTKGPHSAPHLPHRAP